MNSPLCGVTIVEGLIAQGITDVVASPGSRNAPLLIALDHAASDGLLRLHMRVDERVAGFTALGLAKASEQVVAVVTTSGTAVGNLLPAAMEAKAAGIPLLLITADRPATCVGTGANQTCDQVGFLGPTGRGTLRLSSSSGDPQAWRAAVARATALAAGLRTRAPGPVQLNVEFDLPLVSPETPRPQPQVTMPQILTSCGSQVYEVTTDARTVILAGDASPSVGAEARALAEITGTPLLAEPSSNARTGPAIPGYRELLPGLAPEIERVVVYGHPTLSRPVAALLARRDIELIIVASHAEWIDPGHAATTVTDRVILPPGDPAWLQRWQVSTPDITPELSGEAVAAAVVAAVGPRENLVFGASSSIRYADLAPLNFRPGQCWANRGLAGIDGTLATATGIALSTGNPTTVLLGDLTLQHDMGALVSPRLEPRPNLRVILLDDDGGGIFASLEQGESPYRESFDRVFRTSQALNMELLASAAGWEVVHIETYEQLLDQLRLPVIGQTLVLVTL